MKRRHAAAILLTIVSSVEFVGLNQGIGQTVDGPAQVLSCDPRLSTDCSCTMPILLRAMGASKARFLSRIYTATYDQDDFRREIFFRDNAAEVLSVSIAYADVKYVILDQCGVLAFEDGFD